MQGLVLEMDSIDPKVVLGFWGLGHRVEGLEDRGHTQAWLPDKRQATTCHCHSLYQKRREQEPQKGEPHWGHIAALWSGTHFYCLDY